MIGAVTLRLQGRDRIIQGGPFDDFEAPAIGVCLEVRSAKLGQAALVLPVVDFGAPDVAELTAALGDVLGLMAANPDLPVYIGCRAGTRRPGTVIPALGKLAGIANPVAWVRALYHPDAVETSGQRAVIEALDPAMI